MLRALGATPLPRDGWESVIKEMGGVDVVLDGVCNDGFKPSYRSLRKGGRLIVIGASGPAARGKQSEAIFGFLHALVLWRLLPDGKRSQLYSIAYRKKHPDHWDQDLSALLGLLETGEIAPEVAERIGPEDVADAHARLEAGGLKGKIVLDPWA